MNKRRLSTLTVFIAIGLGTLLMTLLPQIKASLTAQLDMDRKAKLPGLFLFDIQDEQLDPLKEFAHKNNVEMNGLSPLVRSRIIRINDQKYERRVEEGQFLTREEERKIRFRNRGVNLTYMTDPSQDDSEIIEGSKILNLYDPQASRRPQLSVEYKYAQDMDIHLHDKIVFDIQGLEVEGEVANFRLVQWTSFRPNFFIKFQAGVLEEAPKTWLTGLILNQPEQAQALQSQLTTQFSNISSVNIRQAVQDVLRLTDQMSSALELISALAILTGFIVLITIAQTQAQQRRNELNLLKVLGARASHLVAYLTFEFGLIAVLASVFGGLLSLVGGFIFSRFVFDQWPRYDVVSLIGLTITVSIAGIALAALSSWQVTRTHPSELL